MKRKRRFWKKTDPIAEAKAKQPDTMRLCVGEYLDHMPEAEIRVYQLGSRSGKPKHVGYMPVRTAADHMARIEEFIKSEYGGGDYRVVFYDAVDKEYAAYEYSLAGKNNYAEADDTGRLRGGDGQFLKEIGIEALKSRLDPSTQLEAYAKILQMAQPQGNNEFEKELMTVLINNHFEKEQNQFSSLREALEVLNTLQPKVQSEDATTTLITSLVPLFAQMAAARQAGGAIDPKLQALLQHPEVQKALAIAQAGTPAPQGQLAQAPQAATLPEPGQQPQPQQPGQQTQPQQPGQQEQPQQVGDAESPVIASAMTSFREHITQGTPAERLTQMFLSMVGLARAWQPDHVLLSPFIDEEDWAKLSEAFDHFCSAIPELAGNAVLQGEIKLTITTMLLTEAEEPEPGPQPEEEQDADVEPGAAAQWPDSDRDDSEQVGREIEPAIAGSHVQGS